ncbi:pseudoazurin [Roseovarius sp. MMSF_3281]|uniref:pseudoazurin n=1 Tax=Roseovarius sp. MMSF_3281 TaxID=3046694 RepID=UPI00273EE4B6|nr:pseudoazurin [Roseovarius sp. MMSF_3281]
MKLLLAALMAIPTLASAEIHEVKMLNRNDTGAMVYEPDFISAQPGDTIRFLASDRGHNAASIKGMRPEGAARFIGQIDEEIEITLDTEGVYGVKCSPHFMMGMVMLIRVGDASLSPSVLPDDLPRRARDRFEAILSRETDDGAAQ